ncbi:MAG: hypothetical protein WC852_07115 [Candidatus Nanoarchaeia archaeon]|jgi:hypothetical protein
MTTNISLVDTLLRAGLDYRELRNGNFDRLNMYDTYHKVYRPALMPFRKDSGLVREMIDEFERILGK